MIFFFKQRQKYANLQVNFFSEKYFTSENFLKSWKIAPLLMTSQYGEHHHNFWYFIGILVLIIVGNE